MTTAAWVFAAVTAAFALTDWWGVVADRPAVRYVAKPATLAALIGVAVTLDPADPTIRTWMVIGLIFSLAGDVFLMLEEKWFVAGLASFLVGHIAYVVALQLAPTSWWGMAVGLALVVISGALVGNRIVAGVARATRQQAKDAAEAGAGATSQPSMVPPVIAYMLVISAMVVSAYGTWAAWAIVGGTLFYISDATLAWNRFIEPRRWGPLTVMVTYHLGQAGLVAWLV